jgi:hypothetical protein
MSDHDISAATRDGFKDVAQRSQEAGIADESAAYENAVEKDAPASIDNGDLKTTDHASGTSEEG